MLITDFIRKNPNWEELLSNPPYSLKIKRKDNLILFNYSQIESDPSNEIVKEARGTIIEDRTFKPICVGFRRFYNIDEPYAAKIDWNSAVATSKEDGTLFFLYWYNDRWHVKTRSTFDAEDAPMNNIKFANFKELFDYLISFYSNFSYEKLNKNYIYCLEGCSNFNKIVIEYNIPCLFHLMTRDMSTLQEVDTEIGIPKPQMYNLDNEEDYRQLVESMSNDHEGIVVRDMYNERVKIKTKSYFELHRMVNNGVVTVARMVELIRANDHEEFLSYFGEYKPMFDKVAKQLKDVETLVECVETYVTSWKEIRGEDRKDFAEKINEMTEGNIPPALFFAAWDNKTDSFMKKLSTEKFIKMFRIGENI